MLKQQWQQLDDTARLRLKGAVVVIGLLLGWLLIWQPLQAQHDKIRQEVRQQAELLTWMHNAAQTLRRYPASSATDAANGGGLQQYISQYAQQHSIRITRIQTLPDGRVQLNLDQCQFNTLLDFLNQLHSRHISVQQISVNRGPEPGIVTAHMTLK